MLKLPNNIDITPDIMILNTYKGPCQEIVNIYILITKQYFMLVNA